MSAEHNKDFRRLIRAAELLVDITKTKERLDNYMKELDDLTAEVTAEETVETSAITLINGIAARITAAGVNPTALSALTTSLKASSDALAAAVAANTPAAPAA